MTMRKVLKREISVWRKSLTFWMAIFLNTQLQLILFG